MGDKLYRDGHWSHRAELPVLGVTTKFLTNSQEVLKVVHETYGAWEALAGYQEVVSRSRGGGEARPNGPPVRCCRAAFLQLPWFRTICAC